MATQAELEQGYSDFVSAMTSGDFGGAANVAASLGFSPAETEAFIEANAAGLGFAPGTDIPSDVVAGYFGGAGGAGGAGYVDQQAVDMLTQFDDLMLAGNYDAAALLLDQATNIYDRDATLRNIADYLNTDPKYADLRRQVGGALYTPENLASFIESAKTPPIRPTTPTTPTTPAGPPTPTLQSIPRLERQTPSMISFAPPRRGLAQLRPAAFMPGLLEGTPGFGGSGFTPEQLQQATTSLVEEGTAAGKTPEQIYQDFAYLMDVGGVSPAELAAAIGGAPGQIQGLYNQARPQGLFSSVSPQTGPTFKDTSQLGAFNLAIAQGDFERGAQIAQAAGFSPQEAEYYINANLSGLNLAQPVAPGTIGSLYGPNAPTPPGLALQTGAFGATVPTFLPSTPTDTATTPGSATNINVLNALEDLQTAVNELQSPPEYATARAGGMIKMSEGGMPKLSAKEAGSRFDVSEFIDEQGRLVGGYSRPVYDENQVIIGYEYTPYERDVVFNPVLARREEEERERMRNMARGGLASVAQDLASRGRGGDTMLVHMAPHEVAGLNALARMQGTELTINPETGMPEALKLGKLFKQLAPMALGFALGPAGAGIFSSALGAGLAVGAGYTLATGSLQQGIAAGLGAYGGSNIATGLQAAGADAAASAAAGEAAGSGISSAAGGSAAEAAMVNPMAPVDYSLAAPGAAEGVRLGTTGGFQASLPEISNVSLTSAGPTAGSVATGLGGGVAPAVPTTTTVPIETVQIGGPQAGIRTTELATVPQSTSGSALTGAERYLGDKATSDLAAQRYADATGSTLSTSLMQTVGGMGLQSAAAEEAAIKARQASINREREERKRLFDQLFGRTLGAVPARSGGLMSLAGGGMTYMEAGGTTGPTGTPRDVTGTGDGMSDSVPATIEGVQEARLADGEFVIPADVVADIGNGSSDAGSKKLYDMMDRIRMARHGTTEQPPEIKAERLMPA